MSVAVMNYPDNGQFGGKKTLLLAHNSRLQSSIAQNQDGGDFKQLVTSLQSAGEGSRHMHVHLFVRFVLISSDFFSLTSFRTPFLGNCDP